ncbi:MAG TPA: hypothetical protein VFS31_10235, partial [Chitinophagaceae bacterium]|nr:hypothetical protein [Chitinophagaceae bacterium]
MKKKFQNLEKLTMGIVLSKSEQKNALGGYGVGGNPKTITCYYIWEGCLPVGGGISVCAGHKRTGVIVNNSKCP